MIWWYQAKNSHATMKHGIWKVEMGKMAKNGQNSEMVEHGIREQVRLYSNDNNWYSVSVRSIKLARYKLIQAYQSYPPQPTSNVQQKIFCLLFYVTVFISGENGFSSNIFFICSYFILSTRQYTDRQPNRKHLRCAYNNRCKAFWAVSSFCALFVVFRTTCTMLLDSDTKFGFISMELF